MKRITLIIAVTLLVCLTLLAQQPPLEKKGQDATPMPAEFRVPPEDAKKQNPVKPTEGSIAEGKHLFTSQCAMCHGAEGDGKGDLAASLELTLKDWRDPESLKKWTDGELFYVLDKGKRHMPGQENRMKEDQKWHLVNFIRSLAKKEAASKETK